MTIKPERPKRGEIWLINFDPTVGAEIKKVRPAVVISSDSVGKIPIKLIAPITDWKTYFSQNLWHIKIESDSTNGLSKDSAIDTLQLRGVDLQRFIRKLGTISEIKMLEVTTSIATVIEFEI
ncbi:MAG: type II toxin-antitoxin system PemK/MazF family toxin [Cyanobacteria bacterium RI_101]|nr:type II toxin-antitoxin system PemK/MazF family toxin [Cyanobacteria bacterium RI_101]